MALYEGPDEPANLIKGTFWHWSCACGNKLQLFARAGLTDEYCEPQMKGHCRWVWKCACEPKCVRKTAGTVTDQRERE